MLALFNKITACLKDLIELHTAKDLPSHEAILLCLNVATRLLGELRFLSLCVIFTNLFVFQVGCPLQLRAVLRGLQRLVFLLLLV
jgi:hypothetical protein